MRSLATIAAVVIAISALAHADTAAGKESAASHYLKADKCRKAGQLGEAINEYLSALELKPDSLPTKKALAACQSARIAQLKSQLDSVAASLGLTSADAIHRETARIVGEHNLTAPPALAADAELDRQIGDLQKKVSTPDPEPASLDQLIAAQDAKLISQKRTINALAAAREVSGPPERFPQVVTVFAAQNELDVAMAQLRAVAGREWTQVQLEERYRRFRAPFACDMRVLDVRNGDSKALQVLLTTPEGLHKAGLCVPASNRHLLLQVAKGTRCRLTAVLAATPEGLPRLLGASLWVPGTGTFSTAQVAGSVERVERIESHPPRRTSPSKRRPADIPFRPKR